jgi:HipA-like protein
MKDKILDVYLKGGLVGELNQDRFGNLSFTYVSEFLSQVKIGISLSLCLCKSNRLMEV